jgi:hypothetical protein
MRRTTAVPEPAPRGAALEALIGQLAHLLPAQGPISIFIHHNTLHAFEHLPFEEAVERAAECFGCQPFLSEERYRAKLASGRIRASDVEVLVAEELGAASADPVVAGCTRFDLWRRVVLHGLPAADGAALAWLLSETPVLSRFREDLPGEARSSLNALGDRPDDRASERAAVRHLWEACVAAAGRPPPAPARRLARGVRHRDALVAGAGVDIDEWLHPPLIRFLGAYLDQGLASWTMPARDRGIHGCFLELCRTSLAARFGPWAADLPRLVAEDRQAGRSAVASVLHSLDELGVQEGERRDYLTGTLLALRGWAGMVHQFEVRPDRVPARPVPATLSGYLAVRLLLERAAIGEAARQNAFDGPPSSLRACLQARMPEPPGPSDRERAWRLFHVAQLCGLDGAIVDRWTAGDVVRLESELAVLDGVSRRRILHLAFERASRHGFYDALAGHTPSRLSRPDGVQAVFCIDEREESFRRHLEEADLTVETFGTPGFFGVAMYHQGATDAHPRPLCPVTIRPAHYVPEVEQHADAFSGRSRRAQRRVAGFLGYNVSVGSRTLVRGAVLMTVLGWLALLPLVLRVVFPWLSSRWREVRETSIAPAVTRLRLDRDDAPPPEGRQTGFTVPELAAIVRRVLEDVGLVDRLAPLVLIVGHGSISLNNPHESAHDCGACGGGRGGPNARAFAQMANDPRVRRMLGAAGLHIEARTWFVGAERNTCNNAVTFYDVDLVPASHRELFERARGSFDTARRREAHERCRRFDAVPAWYPSAAALAHVEGRAADLAQPRPEYGHATNAYCVIGRRTRTAGLFLDRRAFLTSYDPTRDPDGAVLTRVLAGVVPVVAGINLEYYFSYVDPAGYGCGTKLPHNVTALLGVMDGALSDLRTGLPWQMVEIHEPVRLTIVVEADPDRVRRALDADPAIARLVRNRWVWLASLDPASGALWELGPGGARPYRPAQPVPSIVGDSATWYRGKHGFLAPVAVVRADVPVRSMDGST